MACLCKNTLCVRKALKMKKPSLILAISILIIAALLSGCAQKGKTADYNLAELSAKLEKSGAFSDILSPVEADVAAQFYGIEPGDIAECSVLCSTGATTEEIGLFKCVSEDAARKVKAAADKRVESQRTAYESYAPKEMPKLDDAIVVQDGVYVFYIVANDASKAREVLKSK